jgi:uncharacterized protein YciI
MRKKLIAGFLICFASMAVMAQPENNKSKNPADQIRPYWFVLLTVGKERSQDSATAAKIQAGHLANIQRLYLEGKVKVAGPFGEQGDSMTSEWLGLFIFDCGSKEEVETLLKTDPAIAAGRLNYQIKQWYTVPTGSFVPGKPKSALF